MAMSDAKVGSWAVPESPIAIEYSLVVVEEIRRQVTDGLQRLSRGGIEVGGVLYGVHDGDSVRLLAIRPMACEHARGPAFVLSENDREALAMQLKDLGQDPALQGFVCLGWFLSHTRGGIDLTELDLEIYNSFFAEPWQVALVIRPGRASSMRAGFFVREFDGAIRSERSYLEFSFPDRLAAVFDRPPRAARANSERNSIPPVETEAGSAPFLRENTQQEYTQRDSGPTAGAPLFGQEIRTARSGKKWLWLAVWAAILVVVAVLAVRYFQPPARPEPIQLAVVEKDEVLQISWNAAAKPVRSATRGTLEISDGTEPHHLSLSSEDLARGSFSYKRSSGDAEVRLIVEQSDGTKVQEASRFLGQAPSAAPPEDLGALQKRRDQLEEEVKRLKDENETQAGRIQQLERTVRILQTRLGNK
jgi:proteasome lid subunit RPN8/RPN11